MRHEITKEEDISVHFKDRIYKSRDSTRTKNECIKNFRNSYKPDYGERFTKCPKKGRKVLK